MRLGHPRLSHLFCDPDMPVGPGNGHPFKSLKAGTTLVLSSRICGVSKIGMRETAVATLVRLRRVDQVTVTA